MIQRAYRAKLGARRKAATNARAGYPKYRIGRQMGTFGKKGPKPKPITGVKMRIDDHTTVSGTHTCYYGTSGASRYNTIKLLALHMVQDIAKKDGQVLSAWDAVMQTYAQAGAHAGVGRLKYVTLRYRRQRSNAEDEHDVDSLLVSGAGSTTPETYVSLANRIADSFITQAKRGYYPHEYQLIEQWDPAFPDRSYYTHNRFDEDIVEMYSVMNLKLQNVTTAQHGERVGYNINDIDANPLQGRIYDFRHETPRLAAGFADQAETDTNFATISKLGDVPNDNSYLVEVDNLRAMHLPGNDLQRAFRQPPGGAAVFGNCTGAKRLAMPPGGFFTVKRNFTVKCNTKRYIAGTIPIDWTVTTGTLKEIQPVITRKAVMVGLEPTVRTATSETVTLTTNRDMTTTIKLKRARSPNAPGYVEA